MNDTIRIQNNSIKSTGGYTEGRKDGLDGCELRLQQSTSNETYTDGHIDYVQEL